MSAEMGLSPADYRQIVDSSEIAQHHSMDEVYSDQSMWFADVEDRADDLLERDSLKQALARGIGQLPEREAMVLKLYFVEEMNLRSEEHTSELQSLMRISYAVFCLNKKTPQTKKKNN